MIYNFSERKEDNNRLEKGLRELKEEYLNKYMSDEQLAQLQKKMKSAQRMNRRERKRRRMAGIIAAAAVMAGVFMVLPNTSASVAYAMEQIPFLGRMVEVVTFRDYTYESDRNMANIKSPVIKVSQLDQSTPQDNGLQEKLADTAEDINAEIKEITDGLIREFEKNLQEEMGYQDIVVDSEVLASTQDYYVLKLNCYQGAGSGYQWNYYYTIDLHTGERLKLKDLFVEGADYITPISENIKSQMEEQMQADEKVYYWLHDEIEEWNFDSITDDTSFYLNEAGNIVIGFDEGEVAPMYMGTVEFEIPSEVLSGIRK